MNKVLLIDFYNLYIRNFHAVQIMNSIGEHYGGIFGTLRSLKYIIDEINPDEVFVIFDGPNSGMRRRSILGEYKSNRIKEWKRGNVGAYDFLNEREEQENFAFQIERLKEYFSALPVKTISIPHVEADDVIADIVNNYKKNEYIIYSNDSDFFQLLSDNIFCYKPNKKLVVTKESFFDEHGYLAENYIYFKVICGDKSDNIQGIKGVGEKTFIQLYPNVKEEKIKDLDELLRITNYYVDSGIKFTKRILNLYKAILDDEDILRRNWDLMQLRDLNISVNSVDAIREFYNKDINEFDKVALRMMLIKDGLEKHVKDINEWSRSFMRLTMRGKK